MKIIGVIAVIGSCLGIGMTRIRCIRLEMLALESLAGGIRAIRAELSRRFVPRDLWDDAFFGSVRAKWRI